MAKIKRGEVWLANLNPQGQPEEPAKDDRPCLIVQNDLLNQHGYSTTVIIPCTTVTYHDAQGDGFPLKVNLGLIRKPGDEPANTDAFIAGVRAISNRRFKGDAPIAPLSRNQMKRVEDALKIILGL
ncbi:type II toxin-antitoxin system PemK/MazF family toxin [Oxalobacteraceae bacterium A2-2]